MMNRNSDIITSTQRPAIIAELFDAFPQVLGPQFWPRARRIIALIMVVAVLRSIVADCSEVPSGSMIPTLLVGDRVLVNKLAYDLKLPFSTAELLRWADPKRGDVIVCFSPTTGLRLVKRVIAIPGDVVELRDNVLHLNGIPSQYIPADSSRAASTDRLLIEHTTAYDIVHPIMETPSLPARRSFPPTTLPPGKYFVLGDNRDDSLDSRYFGFVDRTQIIGRAERVLISLRDGLLPRTNRLLLPIR
jgi:signal peptidase I